MSWLDRIGRWAAPWTLRNPFTNVYGVSRSLLSLGTVTTLALNRIDVLFTPAVGVYKTPLCDETIRSIYCLAPKSHLDIVRWISVVVLLVVASGWRPRITALPHLWITYSFYASSTVREGGDQISLVLTVLLLPVALLDSRAWHWSEKQNLGNHPYARLVAWSALKIVRLQVAGVYFVAAISKLGASEWANGTALYYWLWFFGAPRWVIWVMRQPIPLTLATWGTIALELFLAMGIVLSREKWHRLLVAGIAFHCLIALFLGLWTFSVAMTAALLLYLYPPDEPLRMPILIARLVSFPFERLTKQETAQRNPE